MARNKEQALDDLLSIRSKVKDLKELEAASAIALDTLKIKHEDDKDRLDAARLEYKAAEKAFRATPND